MTSRPPFNNPLVIQKQIRENATEVQNFLSDLSDWSTEMKAKELAQSSDLDLTPVENLPLRNEPKKSNKKEKESTIKPVPENGKKLQACDYSVWEKFDAEKACEEVEAETIAKEQEKKPKSMEEAAKRRAIEMRLKKMGSDKKELGNQCLKDKQYDKAVEYYSEGIRCDRTNAVLYANRAQAYMFLKQFEKAIDDCNESIKNDVAYVKAYFRRAKARFELGRLVEAKTDLSQALKLQPGNIEAKQLLNEISRKTMQSLFGPTVPKSPSEEQAQGGKDSLFPGIQTKLISGFNRGSVVDSYMDDDDDYGGRGDAEDKEVYPKLIVPIKKSAERRSKRPLLQMHVKVVGEEEGKRMRLDYNGNEGNSNSSSVSASNASSGMNTPVVVPSSPLSLSNSTSVSASLSLTSPTAPGGVPALPGLFSQLKMTTIPNRPKTAAQFNTDWKKLKAYPDMCASYLKQMGTEDYLIFQDSLEYSILTDILDLLVWEFLPQKWDFIAHLKGLVNVKRFSTLVMFMTEKDRANARKLISECSDLPQREEFKSKYKV